MEWTKQKYNEQYESWAPWVEDVYLRWFTKDNKTSYVAKQNLDKTKVTGIDQVDTLQDGVNNLAAGQVGQGGLLEPAGKLVSEEGVNRSERGGKDDKGGYTPGDLPGAQQVNKAGGGIAEGGQAAAGKAFDGVKGAGGYASEGVKGAGGYVGGLFGQGKKQDEQGGQEGQQK